MISIIFFIAFNALGITILVQEMKRSRKEKEDLQRQSNEWNANIESYKSDINQKIL